MISPSYLLFLRFMIPAIIIFLIYPKIIIKEFRSIIVYIPFLLFILTNYLGVWTQTIGLQHTSASNAGFITAFSVVLVPFIKKMHFNSPISKGLAAAVFLALAGIYMISFGPHLPQSFNVGDGFVFICALIYGYYIVLLEVIAKKFSAPTIMSLTFLVSALLALLAATIWDPSPNFTELFGSLKFSANLIALSILGGVIPYLLMAQGQRVVTAQLAALIYILEPTFASGLAIIFLGEILLFSQIFGSLIMVVALIIGIRSQVPANNTMNND